ncbi:MAG: exonuclease SbcCD subunit D [Deltaproteobacteria bacterium]|nr:exonuclease SbcCD subunit D [Deltaproteobacteria bacterium]
MRIVHLADLHLGKVLHGTSLLEDQRHALAAVVALLRGERPDALVLAGDLYDRALPSAEAVRLLDDFLREVHDGCGVPVVAIAGNHDSADHVGFGSWLFSRGALHVRGRADPDLEPVTLTDKYGLSVDFHTLPYVDPEVARVLFGDSEDAGTHRGSVLALLHRAAEQRGRSPRRAVCVVHALVQGEQPLSECPRSERALFLGGAGAVPARAFEGFAYTALGHLHRPQDLTEGGSVRYAGSLLKYSFDEASHDKGATLVSLEAEGPARVEHRSIAPRRDLCRVRGSLEELLRDPALARFEGAYLSAELTDHPRPLQAMDRLHKRFPYALELRWTKSSEGPRAVLSPKAPRVDPEALFQEFYQRFRAEPPTDEALAVFREALADARRAEGA